jgi:hypothetical protein
MRIGSDGATVQWGVWVPAQVAQLTAARTLAATAARYVGVPQIGRVVYRYTLEIERLEKALWDNGLVRHTDSVGVPSG